MLIGHLAPEEQPLDVFPCRFDEMTARWPGDRILYGHDETKNGRDLLVRTNRRYAPVAAISRVCDLVSLFVRSLVSSYRRCSHFDVSQRSCWRLRRAQ
jgi:hypothetical protein